MKTVVFLGSILGSPYFGKLPFEKPKHEGHEGHYVVLV